MNRTGAAPLEPREIFLVDLAQWLARRTQYSATHPSCATLGEAVHASLGRALATQATLEYGILKDGVMMDDVAATHRAILTRVAPHLHARGVQVVRFVAGTTLDELTSFVEILTLPVHSAFDRGGIVKLLSERGVSRIQVEEIAHDIDPNEQEEQKKRKDRRAFFAEVLRQLRAGRTIRGLSGEELLALLDDPEAAVILLEEDPAAITDAVAGLCFMVRKEEARSGRELFPKLRVILLRLSPASQATVLIGLPPLLGNFRSALLWAFDRLSEEDLGCFVLPALRVAELDVALYAILVAIPHDGTRYATLRSVALRFHDLTQAADEAMLRAIVAPIDEHDSFRRERECLATEAKRALDARTLFAASGEVLGRGEPLPPWAARRMLHDLIVLQAKRPSFADVCARLPKASERLSDAGGHEAVIGMLHGLNDAGGEAAEQAMRDIATNAISSRLLDDLDRMAAELGVSEVTKLVPTVSLLVKVNPLEVWNRLERSENVAMQQVLLDALANAGPTLLPTLRGKVRTSSPAIVRFIVALLPRIGGTTRDLALVARHPNEKVRAEVLRALRLLPPDERTMDIVVGYLEDASQELKTTARSLLRAELLSPIAISAMERLADDPDQPEALRKRLVDVLGRSPREAAASALFRLLQPRSLLELGSVREAAAVALRHSNAPNAADLFEQGLQSSVRRIRKACERAERGG